MEKKEKPDNTSRNIKIEPEQTNRISVPPLMETATILEVLTTIPPLRKIPRVVIAATSLGAIVDDCFDLGVERKDKQEISRKTFFSPLKEQVPDRLDPVFLGKFQRAWDNLLQIINTSPLMAEEKDRLIRNSETYVDNLIVVENHALSIPEGNWTLPLAGRYRRAVCLEWAVYFASLAPESNIKLSNFNADEGIMGPKNHYFHLLNEQNETTEWIRRLYYGGSTYQLIGDWTGKEINKLRSIPGYGSIGNTPTDEKYVSLLAQYLRVSMKHGMSPIESLVASNLLPIARNFLNWRIQKTLNSKQ